MENLLIFIVVIGVILFLVCILFLKFLQFIDSRINYENKLINYYFLSNNGSFQVRVPYYFWQTSKKLAIEARFSEEITFENRVYEVLASFKNQDHLENKLDIFPSWFYRDYVIEVDLKREENLNYVVYGDAIIGDSNIVSRDNSTITINQDNRQIIYKEIYSFYRTNQFIDLQDKNIIDDFMDKLKGNNVNKWDIDRVVDILNKYIPFSTAIINLIRAL
ncbi:hypothetical protein [Ornithinibacillus sp. 179-J 7C1 HS]|uniref:hypothetical protein n=1 Tax=Ornithinibacillus sp. 179-J 7C1 HS TaxID=3142384 RepID=UPI0039A053AA